MAINLYSKASVDSLLSPKLSISSLSNAAATTLNATAPTTNQVLSYDGTELKWATVSGGGGAAWGGITGTLSSQTDLQNALDLKAPLASPTFTGTVTIPAGASISGYLTNSTASSTYLAKASNLSDLANTGTARTNLGLGGLAVLNDAPSDGSQYARQSGAWAVVTGGGGGGGGTDIQSFGTAGSSGTFTWTKPANAKWVQVTLVGGGGGGGGGGKSTANLTGVVSGGGGAAGGAKLVALIAAADIGPTATVVVGAGGPGGNGATSAPVGGFPGTNGSDTTFAASSYTLVARGGNFGNGGSTSATTPGGSAKVSVFFNFGVTQGGGGAGQSATGGTSPSPVTNFGPSGGGGGAGSSNSTTQWGGGAGGPYTAATNLSGITVSVAGGAGAAVIGPGGNGTSVPALQFGTGGGGGGTNANQPYTAAAGGNGGWPGGGGGGGGASFQTAYNAGKGGNGSNGVAYIVTFC